MIGKGSREGTCEARLRYFGELFVPSFRFEVDFFSLAYTRALLSHAPCPAPPRSATRAHACTRVAHVWPTHARTVFLPAGRCGLEAALGLVVPSARPAWFPAPRPRLPRRRPPPLLAPWPPLPVAFGSPPSDSQRWAFSEPPVPFPRPGPRTRVPGPHAQPRLSHAPPPAMWRLSQRTNVALLHLTPGVAS